MSQLSEASAGVYTLLPGGPPPRALPRGRHRLGREVVLLSQRSRLLDGMARAVAERGFVNATVADALRHARVSRATFYQTFRDKEDCFHAAYVAASRVHHHRVLGAVQNEPDRSRRLLAGTAAYLDVLDEQPVYARAFLVEIAAAGPRLAQARSESIQAYVELLQRWYTESAGREHGLRLPDGVLLAYVVGSNELVIQRLQRRAPRLHELLPMLMYMQLSLFGMPDEAAAALETRPRRRGRNPD